MRRSRDITLSTVIAVILSLAGAATAAVFAGQSAAGPGERLNVVCTVLPVWALARDVTDGIDGIELSLLLESAGGCPHDYAMTPRDRKRLAQAKLVLANGLGLERFLKGDDMPRIVEVGVGCRLIRVGAEEAHDGDERGHEHEHEHGDANPHVWLSPAEAMTMTRAIGDALASADPPRKDGYAKGVERVVGKLEKLRDECAALGGRLKQRKIIAPAGVFEYLARDLGVETVATFDTHEGAGISTRKLREIVAAAKKPGAAAIFFDAGASARTAEMIAGETKLPKFELDTLIACDKFPPAADWYATRIRSNLATIEKALGAP